MTRIAYRLLDGQPGHEAGRALLAELYAQQTGEALPPIQIDQWGKPRFVGSPFHFSISHTKRHVFCILGTENVAIDAEELGRDIRPNLPKRVLSPEELAQYETAPDKNRAFLTFWVLKEAAAKLDGRGLRGFPNHTHFSLTDLRVREISGCLVAVMTGETDYAL